MCLSAHGPPSDGDALAFEALFYYNKGLNSVNDRLGASLRDQSNGIVVSILGLAVYSLTNADMRGWCWETKRSTPDGVRPAVDEWALHVGALKTILDSRGGVTSIDKCPELRKWLML